MSISWANWNQMSTSLDQLGGTAGKAAKDIMAHHVNTQNELTTLTAQGASTQESYNLSTTA
jgi:hypothetical protein